MTTTPEPLKFERRRCPRESARGTARAVYTDGTGRAGLTPIEMVDSSTDGLGLRSRCRIKPGMMVTIFHGSGQTWTEATAVRCTPDGDRFRIGLLLDRPQRMAA
jgi:hypothetical protein